VAKCAVPLAALALMLSLAQPAAADSHYIRLTTEEYPPFNFSESTTGKILGMSTDLVRAMMEKAAVGRYTIEMLPWQRAYDEALTNPNACVFSTTETEDRLPLFKWVGPLVSNDWVFLARPDSPIKIDSLEAARPYVIGGYRGDATANFLKKNGFTVLTAPEDRHNVKLLTAGRIDLWATGSLLGPWLARQEGMTDLRVLHRFRTMVLSLACNPAVADDTIDRLQEALDALERDGTAAAIRGRYN